MAESTLRTSLLGATMALLAAVVACGAEPFSSESGDGGPILVPQQESYPSSLLEGTLEVKHECFVAGEAVLLLPVGTTWDPESQELMIDGTPARVGDPVSLGGGEVPGRLVEELAGSGERASAEACLEKGAGDALFLVSGAEE